MAAAFVPDDLPKGTSTITAWAINTTTDMVVEANMFAKPDIPGFEQWALHTFAFLLHNPRLGRTVLFDSGSRKDWWNLPPAVVTRIKASTPRLKVERGVAEILKNGGVDLEAIDDIVVSHWHWE